MNLPFTNIKRNLTLKLALTFMVLFVFMLSGVQAQLTNSCTANTAVTVGGHSVTFLGVTYAGSGSTATTTFTYRVTSGFSPSISHFNFGNFVCASCFDDDSDFQSTSGGNVSFGTDPATNLCGIKYDFEIQGGQSTTVSFTLKGSYSVGTITFGVKAGTNVEFVSICGPVCLPPTILSLGNAVWNDANKNGVKDATEMGITGAIVNLYRDTNGDNVADGAAIATTTTDANGNYIFNNLSADNYIVGVVIPVGYAPSTTTTTSSNPNNDINDDNNGVNTVSGEVRSNRITLVNGGEPTTDGDGNLGNLTLDFGFKVAGSIGNFVWNDLNGNGIQNAGEPGLAGVTVTLKNAAGVTIQTVVTDANGAYLFSNLDPLVYSVTFSTPSGFAPSPANQGTNDALDSDPINGVVANVSLVTNPNNLTIDAGFVNNSLKLGNFVWNDLNFNGEQDAGEPGIAGVTVKLYADANLDGVADGTSLQTTTTSTLGIYVFSSLIPGSYVVGLTLPAGVTGSATTATSATPNNDNTTDNNGTNTTVTGEVRSGTITLTTGGEPATAVDGDDTNGNLTLDFGLKGTASLGNFVFNDNNQNGIQDLGDAGIAGVTVTLTYPGGITRSTTTNLTGQYQFANLIPGTYSLAFTTPIGYLVSPANQGGNDNIDSDPITGVVSNIILTAGQSNQTIDAGFYRTVTLAGNVWHDANAMLDNQVNRTSIISIPVGINVYLVDAATNVVIDATSYEADGTYFFENVQTNKTYFIVLSSVGVNPGQQAPKSQLPSGWRNTGQNLGAGLNSGSDGINDGVLEVSVEMDNVTNANFGIRRSTGEIVIG